MLPGTARNDLRPEIGLKAQHTYCRSTVRAECQRRSAENAIQTPSATAPEIESDRSSLGVYVA